MTQSITGQAGGAGLRTIVGTGTLSNNTLAVNTPLTKVLWAGFSYLSAPSAACQVVTMSGGVVTFADSANASLAFTWIAFGY